MQWDFATLNVANLEHLSNIISKQQYVISMQYAT